LGGAIWLLSLHADKHSCDLLLLRLSLENSGRATSLMDRSQQSLLNQVQILPVKNLDKNCFLVANVFNNNASFIVYKRNLNCTTAKTITIENN
jgi:hypothetical protein